MIHQFRLCLISALAFASFKHVSSQDSTRGRQPYIIPIKDAVSRGLMELDIRGAYDPRFHIEVIDKDGLHYGKCMMAILTSKLDSMVLVRLDCGTLIVPDADSVQTMIVTHDVEFPLYPGRTYAARFYAMCTEFHDLPPDVFRTFRIGGMADSSLMALARHLALSHQQNMIGQHAVWALTDQVKFEELEGYGADSLSVEASKNILNALKLETALNPYQPLPEKEVADITMRKSYFYGGLGMMALLTVATITLMMRRKRISEESA